MILVVEGIVMCFVLLLTCVIGIANGPVGLVLLYEEDVQQCVVELGLTSKEKIKKNFLLCSIALFVPMFVLPPMMVYGINGATGFLDGFWQIPDTEDLKPYIPTKVMIRKWFGTIVLNPIIAAIVAGIMQLF